MNSTRFIILCLLMALIVNKSQCDFDLAASQAKLPEFMTSEIFWVRAEAKMMYSNPDEVLLTSIRMVRNHYNYAAEISDGPNTTRIIQNLSKTGRYIIDTETGECKSEDLYTQEIFVGNLAVTWPFHISVGFNLLKSMLGKSGIYSNYAGQVETDGGLMDVWEYDLNSFFQQAYHTDASVNYYFPVIDRSENPHQAPAKLVMKPKNGEHLPMSFRIPNQIEIVFSDYAESDFGHSNLFDLSSCLDGNGEFNRQRFTTI